jgi:hypothetical protein
LTHPVIASSTTFFARKETLQIIAVGFSQRITNKRFLALAEIYRIWLKAGIDVFYSAP